MKPASPPSPFRDGGGDALPFPRGRGVGGEGFSRGPGMTAKARALRLNMTDAERVLWRELRRDRLGVRFRRQMPVFKRYILDFYAPEVKLAVEVDGGQHADDALDALRTGVLHAHGISVLRFWNHEVLGETDAVVQAVADVVGDLRSGSASPLSPLRDGGGDGAARGLRFFASTVGGT